MKFLRDATRGKCRPQMYSERQHRVVLGLSAEAVILSHNDKALGEFSDSVNDVGGFEVARFSLIYVGDLDGVLDNSFTGR
jgi:hypothetical protein